VIVPTTRPQTAGDEGARDLDEALAKQLRLTTERVLSADGDSFVTLLCRDASGARRVLKYVSSGTADAHRRLTNETRLMAQLQPRPPLRLLTARAAGPGYVVTDYDAGRLLRVEHLDDDPTLQAIAGALVEFQTAATGQDTIGIVDRGGVTRYYLKTLLKHILHLWPAQLRTADAARSMAAVAAALPTIVRERVPCHGDFLPTNLLYDAAGRSVTFTDLEGFMTNHPLFDVLALCTIDGADLRAWRWQPRFVRFYLQRARAALDLDPRSRRFADAYRGILVFFLVYRLNEARIALSSGAYFDGTAKLRYLGRKTADLLRGRTAAWRPHPAAALQLRTANLRLALSRRGFRGHLEAMVDAACA
jgi:aminoglycoside phosphotransferase (APT) family kinase protein